MSEIIRDARKTTIVPSWGGGNVLTATTAFDGWVSPWIDCSQATAIRLYLAILKNDATYVILRPEFDDEIASDGYRNFRPAPADSNPYPDDIFFTMAGFAATLDKVTYLVPTRGAGKVRFKAAKFGGSGTVTLDAAYALTTERV